MDMARTMLDGYKTSNRFWAEAVNTACYAINRLYLHRILKKTSYELLTGKKPNVSYFRVFGSKCFILVKRGRKSKFAPKAIEVFLLGYDSNTRAYRVFNKSTGDVCPKESEEPPQAQDQPSSSMQASPPTQDEDQAQDNEDEDQEDHLKRRAMIKGEMLMIKTRKMMRVQNRHTQESTKQSNEITP
jgi:hypothetical protein